MNREDPYRDQAERLRKKIEKNTENKEQSSAKEKLPPRSRLHREKKKKNKWKIKYPIISLLALFFILLPVVTLSMYNYLTSDTPGGSEKVNNSKSGYETVGYEDKDDTKNTKIEERETAPIEDKGKTDSNNQEVIDKGIPTPRDPVVGDKSDKGTAESEKETDDQTSDEEQNEEPSVIYHTVKSNENLYRIALKYYNSQSGVDIIRKANNLNNTDIHVGQVLTIPKN